MRLGASLWPLVGLILCVLAQKVDHYATLGIKKTATLAEVKRAYRAKALTSHPDKAAPGEVEAATAAFRQIAEAYETLSDPQERRRYDLGGARGGGGRGGGSSTAEWFWSSSGGFGGRQQHWHNWHHEQFLRPEVRRAQERPIKLRSLSHLRSSALGDDDVTERAVLLALTDGTEQCANALKFETQFPAPFAGWSDATMGSGLWWCAPLPTRAAGCAWPVCTRLFTRPSIARRRLPALPLLPDLVAPAGRTCCRRTRAT